MSRVVIALSVLFSFSAMAEHTGGATGRQVADPAVQQEIANVLSACGVDSRGLDLSGLGGSGTAGFTPSFNGSGVDPSTGGIDVPGGSDLPDAPPASPGSQTANAGDTGAAADPAALESGTAKCIACHTTGEGAGKRKFSSKEDIKAAQPSAAKLEVMFGKAKASEAEKAAIRAFLGV